ncbi:hypothetical protein L1987_59122 [Smallanthus sonchifolius]|uniref:Uncharacterized protein n=1 Tax=Smallanthus sonchifolius TaxID=185202 RepID=A0ACB9D4Q0_9ASTR|nr:hypothetical protein L1987_59122 [Smallanthus sonchifolius]
MEKKSHSAKCNPSVKEVVNQRRNKGSVVNSVEQPKNDVPAPSQPPLISTHLCFPNEDMAEIERKYKVLHPQPVTFRNYFQKLGFLGGYGTLMYVSNKKAKFSGKSLYALGRSWFKEGVTEKDERVSTDMHKKEKCHRSDDDEAKGYLKEFVEQAKAAKVLARMSRKKGKTVQKHVLSTSAPPCGKKKRVSKMRSLSDIMKALDQE